MRFMSQRVTIKRISGSTVCEIEARLEGSCLELKKQISDYLGICDCKFRLLAGAHEVMGEWSYRSAKFDAVWQIMKFIEPDFVLQFIEQPIVLTNAADLHASGVCFKCMREVGVQAHQILGLPMAFVLFPTNTAVASAMREAGFSLVELLRARDLLGVGPSNPLTKRSLFDSQF